MNISFSIISHFYTKEAERKNADIKQEKANCKSLTEIKRMSKKNTTDPQVTLKEM